MRDIIPFMVMINLSFIFNIHISEPEVFFKYMKITNVALPLQNITIFHREQKTLLLNIIVSEDL